MPRPSAIVNVRWHIDVRARRNVIAQNVTVGGAYCTLGHTLLCSIFSNELWKLVIVMLEKLCSFF
jgi:hypothetical protein